MLRTLAISLVTLLAVDGVSVALDATTGLSLVPEAAAQIKGWTGKIKRIRIKKKRVGTGYKVVARAGTGDAGDGGALGVKLSDADTGAVLFEGPLGPPKRARLRYTGSLEAGADTPLSAVTVYPEVASGADLGLNPDEDKALALGLTLDGGGEAVLGPLKLRGRITHDGRLRLVIGHADRGWDPSLITAAAFTVDGGKATDLALDEVSWTFSKQGDAFNWDTAAGDNPVSRVRIEARYESTLGELPGADSLIETITLDETAETVGLSQVTLKETHNGDTKLVTWTSSGPNAAALEVDLVDNETGEHVLATTDDTPILTVRSYVYQHIQFDAGADPVGPTYAVLLDLNDANGDPTGAQLAAELTVPAYDAETDTDGTAWTTVTDPTGVVVATVGFYATAEGFDLAMAYSGDNARDIASVSLTFEEPFEGPGPLETAVELSLSSQRSKWVQKAAGAVPASYTLTTTLTTPEGEVLDAVSATGGGAGTVYRASGNGKGTRKAASQAQQQHVPLL